MNKEKTNLTLRPDVKAKGQELMKLKKCKSLSELFELLITEEAARDTQSGFVEQLAALRADVTSLKEASAEYKKKTR